LVEEDTLVSYRTPPPVDYPVKRLVEVEVEGGGAQIDFYDRIEIGRFHKARHQAGVLMVRDPTVSSHHCVITQDRDGTCFVRDTSRNGTRIDGRRLSPNSKTELKPGQILSVGRKLRLRLDIEDDLVSSGANEITASQTMGVSNTTIVTILVGDIRRFTTMVQTAPSTVLQESVARVFARLEKAVVEHGGTLKEFQGDAIFAFWEQGSGSNHAARACRAALDLHGLAEVLARDRTVWALEDFPLEMDWALTTGFVAISGYGGENILGLSMVGEAVVLAFRLEKLADDSTGPIVACPDTRLMAADSFEFEDLGSRRAEGFEKSQRLYALKREKLRARAEIERSDGADGGRFSS
jgi:class 3 adenylate cyclase